MLHKAQAGHTRMPALASCFQVSLFGLCSHYYTNVMQSTTLQWLFYHSTLHADAIFQLQQSTSRHDAPPHCCCHGR